MDLRRYLARARVVPAAASTAAGPAVCAVVLIAISPEFITHSFTSLTFLYGTAWLLGALVLLERADPDRVWSWAPGGFVLGLAALGRFQSFGFLLGALLCVPFLRTTWRRRVEIGALLLGTAAFPLVIWTLFLRVTQGAVPANYNFVHLTLALGEFRSFVEVPALVVKYGSMLGVLRADPLNFFRIVMYGLVEALRFLLTGAPSLIALGAGLLVPGVILLAVRRESYAPWIGALVLGYVLTGIGSRGWAFYYVLVLPLFVYLVAVTIEALRPVSGRLAHLALWSAVLASTAMLSAARVPKNFREYDWGEWLSVRRYLQAHGTPRSVVTTTAATLAYDAAFRFVDQDSVLTPADSIDFPAVLRKRGVDYSS